MSTVDQLFRNVSPVQEVNEGGVGAVAPGALSQAPGIGVAEEAAIF